MSIPHVLRQTWRASSCFIICFITCMSSSEGLRTFDFKSSPAFAFFSRFKSSQLHSNIHCDNWAMNVGYRGCDSVVQPVAKRHIRCHASRWMVTSSQAAKRALHDISFTTAVTACLLEYWWWNTCQFIVTDNP